MEDVMPGRGSEKRKMDEQVLIRLHTEEMGQLRQLADASGMSVAEFLRRLIHATLGQEVPAISTLRCDPELLTAMARMSCEVGRQTGQLKQLCKTLRETLGRGDLHTRAERLLAKCESSVADILANLKRLKK